MDREHRDYLGGRGGRARVRPSEAREHLDDDDHRLAEYERGPWPSVAVPEPPAALLRLFAHVTGRTLELHEFEVLERIRASVDYRGLTGGGPAGTTAPPPRRAPEAARSPQTVPWFDPDDLGETEIGRKVDRKVDG